MAKSTEVFKDALFAMAKSYPDSVVARLLAHFEVDFIAKFIRLYSGQVLHVPSKENIWRNYRDKVIRKTLDSKDDKDTRRNLSRFFSISLPCVSAIYHREKKKHPGADFIKVDAIARNIFEKKSQDLRKEMEELFSGKS